MLSQPGQDVADAAARVADAGGMSLGPATMFTGLAISAFCPGAMSSLANGESPIPLAYSAGLGSFGFRLGATGSAAGASRSRPLPLDNPRRCRHIHGISRFCVHRACEYIRDRKPGLTTSAVETAQSWLLPGKPSASAAAAANSACPAGEPCTRSGLQTSGSLIDSAS